MSRANRTSRVSYAMLHAYYMVGRLSALKARAKNAQ